MMRVAQSGSFALGTGSRSYLEFDLLEHTDQLTLDTTAVSGAYYFVPSVEALRRFASPDDE